MSEPVSPLADFTGRVPLFPLPNLVLFPQVIQPLHIFEPRYRQMTADALAGDKLIALALLKPGWEAEYNGSPAVHPVACVGRIIADQRLADGRYNILLRGLSRIQINQEIPYPKPYRLAGADLLVDVDVEDHKLEGHFKKKFCSLVPKWFGKNKEVLDQVRKLFKLQLSLSDMCDIFAFTLNLEIGLKQELLEELDVERRVRRLLTHLAEHAPVKKTAKKIRKFPPEFSRN